MRLNRPLSLLTLFYVICLLVLGGAHSEGKDKASPKESNQSAAGGNLDPKVKIFGYSGNGHASVAGIENPDDRSAEELLNNHPRVKTLVLEGKVTLSADGFGTLSKLRHLEEVSFRGGLRASDAEGLSQLGGLKAIGLTVQSGLLSVAEVQCFSRLSRLQALNLQVGYGKPLAGDGELAANVISKFPDITSLVLSGNIIERDVVIAAGNLNKLEVISKPDC